MAAPKQHPAVPPNLPDLFNKTIADLRAKLDDPAIAEAARGALRTIIDRVAIFPGAARGQYRIELTGDMAILIYLLKTCCYVSVKVINIAVYENYC